MFCKHCGKKIPDGQKTCPSCGKSVKSDLPLIILSIAAGILVVAVLVFVVYVGTNGWPSSNETPTIPPLPTEEPGTKMIECSDCGAGGLCMTCYGHDEACEDCGGTFACASCEGTGYVESPSHFYNTVFILTVYRNQYSTF